MSSLHCPIVRGVSPQKLVDVYPIGTSTCVILVSSNADESQIVDGSFVPANSTLVNPVNPKAP